ncbi:MAG: HEAT repeat domain-containing protein [Paraprevotella sp.]|nr:HEAT repeat domain-containing protein [Paraprevotella sp.]
MKKLVFTLLACLCFALHITARNGFAIVIDSTSYQKAQPEVEAYAQAIERCNGLKVYTIIDKWQVPDSIRATLRRMHEQKSEPIVGAVFIGDIPVAMIRDAQYMTSAFKMNQKNDRRESSVPSDRFYDDFKLQFVSQGKDEEKPYFYYSLTAQGSQKVDPDIYSGRIRPTDTPESSRYQKLKDYLTKAVREKDRQRTLGQLFFFSGHGYISESKTARMDEKIAYFEHFPSLAGRTNRIGYMDHSDHYPVKENLMNELTRTDLDLAILHHHGDFDMEYLNGTEPIRTVREAKDYIIRNMRIHVNEAREKGRNYDSLRVELEKLFDVPSTWLGDNPTSDSLRIADSTMMANEDLHIEDFKAFGYRPNVPVVVIDACFCGSFHRDDCMANEYIFQPGSTVAVVANTVNVLQDKWYDRFIGLTAQGGCVGDVARFSGLLESHVIGNPTFRFAPVSGSVDVEDLLIQNKVSSWKKLLKSSLPDVQSLAIDRLTKDGQLSSADLLDIYRNSPYGIVRLEALMALADLHDDNFITAVSEASQDTYELAQRQAIRFIAKSGDVRLIPALIKLAISNNTSDRCNFNVMTALSVFPKDSLLAEFDRQFDSPSVQYLDKSDVRTKIRNTIAHSADRLSKEVDKVVTGKASEKDKNFTIRALRNNIVHYQIPELLTYLQNCNDENTQCMLLEALGWHTLSCHAGDIAATALKMSKEEALPESVRQEALKTYSRIHAN